MERWTRRRKSEKVRTCGSSSDIGADTSTHLALRVEYAKARARARRYEEEEELVLEEMRRTLDYLK
jgi:hypothetical protein